MTDVENHAFKHYPGGKGRSYQHVINLMPPHERYVETHVGGGAVLRRKRPARENIIIDADPIVVGRWLRKRPPGVEVLHGDAVAILPMLGLDQNDLIYADPPYHPESRRTKRYYRFDYDHDDHVKLIDTLKALPCRVVLSGYRNELYEDRLSDWVRTDYVATTHNGVVTESAWTNFRPGPTLHDYRYVGRNFRERESFRRKTEGIVQRMSAAEPVELNAVLAELATSHPEAVLQAAKRISA